MTELLDPWRRSDDKGQATWPVVHQEYCHKMGVRECDVRQTCLHHFDLLLFGQREQRALAITHTHTPCKGNGEKTVREKKGDRERETEKKRER